MSASRNTTMLEKPVTMSSSRKATALERPVTMSSSRLSDKDTIRLSRDKVNPEPSESLSHDKRIESIKAKVKADKKAEKEALKALGLPSEEIDRIAKKNVEPRRSRRLDEHKVSKPKHIDDDIGEAEDEAWIQPVYEKPRQRRNK